MDPEFLKQVTGAIEQGLTSASWMVIILGLASAGAGAFLGSYFKRKGENFATKEDFDSLLEQVEAQAKVTEEVRNEYAKDLSLFTEYLKGDLSRDMAQLQASLQEDVYYKTEIFLPRLEAYKALWELTFVVRPTRKEPLSQGEKDGLRHDMTVWYYKSGYGICLSLKGGRLWRIARHSLARGSDRKIKCAFSALKTCLKEDIKVYGELDAKTELGD